MRGTGLCGAQPPAVRVPRLCGYTSCAAPLAVRYTRLCGALAAQRLRGGASVCLLSCPPVFCHDRRDPWVEERKVLGVGRCI